MSTDYLKIDPTPKAATFNHKPENKLLFNVLHFIRVFGAWTFALTTVWFIWLLTPLLFLYPKLKQMGVPNNYLPLEVLTRYYARLCVIVGGLKVVVENPYPFTTPTILCCNHLSRLDAFIAVGWSPEPVKFIMKKELVWQLPMIMGLGVLLGSITIDRNDRNSSIDKMNQAAEKIKKSRVNIFIYPEGTRSVSGKLQEFKKGAFHIAKASKAPITPSVVIGTWDLWKPHTAFFYPGIVKYKILKAIEITDDKDYNDLLLETRTAMAKAIEEDTFVPSDYNHIQATIPAFTWLVALSSFIIWFFF